MDVHSNIRNLYHPVQPAIRHKGNGVTYQEFLPHESLRGLIYCYWQLETSAPLDAQFNYRVVADGCIDIFFEKQNPAESFVMGFCRQYTEFPLGNSFSYVGIRFLPSMFPQLFNIDASELSNRVELLNNISEDAASYLVDRCGCISDTDALVPLLDSFFISLMHKKKIDYDGRLYEAIEIILKNFGMVDIETELDTGISSRQLRRLFRYYIGDTAKSFSKVVRFQNILKSKPSTQSLRENKLFFDAGYYDQAHFIKEFRNFYGVTPSKAFGR